MTWRFLLAAGWVGLASLAAAETKLEYVPLDAPAGSSQAVIVQGFPLVHTRQLMALDRDGKMVGEGSAEKQIEQVLANLEAVLKDAGSGLDKLVRLNVYALDGATVARLRETLAKRLDAKVRPVITAILTPLPHRKALLAVDAVAAGSDGGQAVTLKRCEAVGGDKTRADAAMLPVGGVAYLSGQPDEGGLTAGAVVRSMNGLMTTLRHLKLAPEQVVQLKIFLRPASSAEEVFAEVQKFFPNQLAPPVVFVEWLAAMPIEIELIAQYPLSDKPGEGVRYFTPPEVRPANTFSKVALVESPRQIYLAGLYAKTPSRGEPQSVDVFGQLKDVLAQTGSDLRHMAKATYYVSDDDAARWVDKTRPVLFDPDRPPAASKLMIHAMALEGRTMTVDMIAVPAGK